MWFNIVLYICFAMLFSLICYVIYCYIIAKKTEKEKPISEFYEEVKSRKSFCKLDEISTNIKMTVITLEDKDFFSHKGFVINKIFNAFYINAKFRKIVLGGSCITQQLAKNMYFPFKKIYRRKICELFVAIKLEKTLTKKEILEMYFNIIYFGMEQYNIKDACEFYFDKDPSQVSLNQAITLAALLPAPTKYNPLSSYGLFPQAKKRAVKKLCEQGILNSKDAQMFLNAAYDEELNNEITQAYNTKLYDFYNTISTIKRFSKVRKQFSKV